MFDCDSSDRSQLFVERGAMIDVVGLGVRRGCLMFLGGRREMMFTERNNCVRPYKWYSWYRIMDNGD